MAVSLGRDFGSKGVVYVGWLSSEKEGAVVIWFAHMVGDGGGNARL